MGVKDLGGHPGLVWTLQAQRGLLIVLPRVVEPPCRPTGQMLFEQNNLADTGEINVATPHALPPQEGPCWARGPHTHPHQHREDPGLIAEAQGQSLRQLEVLGLRVGTEATWILPPHVLPPPLQCGHPVIAQLLPELPISCHGAGDRRGHCSCAEARVTATTHVSPDYHPLSPPETSSCKELFSRNT